MEQKGLVGTLFKLWKNCKISLLRCTRLHLVSVASISQKLRILDLTGLYISLSDDHGSIRFFLQHNDNWWMLRLYWLYVAETHISLFSEFWNPKTQEDGKKEKKKTVWRMVGCSWDDVRIWGKKMCCQDVLHGITCCLLLFLTEVRKIL